MSIPAAEALPLNALIVLTPDGVASRILAKTAGGNVTLFAFDAGQGLTEHTSPFEALVQVLDGHFRITVGATPIEAPAGTIVLMPAGIAHAVDAPVASRMLLTMLK
ncbi:MAG TPA: cupin domain-containing protein [Vicinamibacterales bacterium]|nr:cupin domain-containing protein [Vicinamibacterales bacterium]